MESFNKFAEQWNPEICKNNYGSIMIDSSLADWIELLALSKQSVPWSTIMDYLKKDQNSLFIYRPPMMGPDLNEWNSEIPKGRDGEGDGEGDDQTDYDQDSLSSSNASKDDFSHESEDLEEEANRETITLEERVRNLINTRGQYLTDLYPFKFKQNVLQLNDDVVLGRNPYILILCISILKGWENSIYQNYSLSRRQLGQLNNIVTGAFEFVVDAAFKAVGLKSFVIGTAHRDATFFQRLVKAAEVLGLPKPLPKEITKSKYSKDGGVDVVSGYIWNDNHKCERLFLVQAACGQEGEWNHKLRGVRTSRWANYFRLKTEPIALLAVPYQMTDQAVANFLDDRNSETFLDRLRLVKLFGSADYDFNFEDEGNEAIKDFKSKCNEYLDIDLS